MKALNERQHERQDGAAGDRAASRSRKKRTSSKGKQEKDKKELERLRLELEEKSRLCTDLQDKYLRALADLDNYRKRVRKEIQAAYGASNERLICDILPILDNFERALDPDNAGDAETFKEGVRLIYNMLKAVLEKEGVRDFCSIGEKFNPARHEAVYAVESEEHPAETVIQEIEKGYTIGERLLRPARVSVSKGPAQTMCQEEDGSDEPEDNRSK
ncbi:MAG: nucleotide exchange factor GrpE [bacterium]